MKYLLHVEEIHSNIYFSEYEELSENKQNRFTLCLLKKWKAQAGEHIDCRQSIEELYIL